MKKNLERIDCCMFRPLTDVEQLGLIGADGTTGPTLITTGPVANHPDIIADFREDPPS